ncbi:MAG: choice-of-anchor L domain-containing protein [Myxococcota bacterium]|nr:choice-of-anchor L domain-containing protein [Myxococcota bacterium]
MVFRILLVTVLFLFAFGCGSFMERDYFEQPRGTPEAPDGEVVATVDNPHGYHDHVDEDGIESSGSNTATADTDDQGVCASNCGENQVRGLSDTCVCLHGFSDCDGEPENGCERAGSCECELGTTRSCYFGPAGTEGVGRCSGGTQVCTTYGWGSCDGQITPEREHCSLDGWDNDCDGLTDEDSDEDNDGFTICQGDCCDSGRDFCGVDPSKVNPGALEFEGNRVDDNCNGIIDEPQITECSVSESFGGAPALGLVQALGICEHSNWGERNWGLLDARLARADGLGEPSEPQVSVVEQFGGLLNAPSGGAMAVLSSGQALGIEDDGWIPTINWESRTPSVSAPEAFLNAHNGTLQSREGCPTSSSRVFDSVRLDLDLRVPTNANGIQFKFRFFSYEYPLYLCSEYNDFFLALLRSEHPDVPNDMNIAFDSGGNPVSVNNAFFTTCEPQACQTPTQQEFGVNAPLGTDSDEDGCVDSLSCNQENGLCEGEYGACPDGVEGLEAFTPTTELGGATAWLTTQAPVIPGEIIRLSFLVWDTGDGWLDSTVLLDQFEWLLEPTEVVTKRDRTD